MSKSRKRDSILSTPIKTYKFADPHSTTELKEAVEARLAAAAASEGVEYEPDSPRFWEAMTWKLFERLYPDASKVLDRPRGGTKASGDDAYLLLAQDFDTYVQKSKRNLLETAHAKKFLKISTVQIGARPITNYRALLNAVRLGRALQGSKVLFEAAQRRAFGLPEIAPGLIVKKSGI